MFSPTLNNVPLNEKHFEVTNTISTKSGNSKSNFETDIDIYLILSITYVIFQ